MTRKLDEIEEVEVWIIARSSDGEWVGDEEGEESFEHARIYQQTIGVIVDPSAPLSKVAAAVAVAVGKELDRIDALRERQAAEG